MDDGLMLALGLAAAVFVLGLVAVYISESSDPTD